MTLEEALAQIEALRRQVADVDQPLIVKLEQRLARALSALRAISKSGLDFHTSRLAKEALQELERESPAGEGKTHPTGS